MKTNQMKAEILQLGQEWKNATKTEKVNIADKISSYFLDSPEEQITELLGAVRSLAWLNDAGFNRLVASLHSDAQIKKLMPLHKKQHGRRHKLAERHAQLLEKEFASADFTNKTKIFKEANRSNGDDEIGKANYRFCRRHWMLLISLISNLEKGITVYDALISNHINHKEVWPTVAAIKTIRLWTKQSSIEDIASEQHKILTEFGSSLNPGKILIAQAILNKM